MTVQMIERELAKRLIYSQRALRLAQGINVEPAAVTRPPAAAAAGTGAELTVLQKMKQFDAARREQWQDQVEVRPYTIPPSVWDWEQCIAMSVSVYMSTCLPSRIFQKPNVQTSPNFMFRSSSVGIR